MAEKDIERFLVNGVKKLGGVAYKFVSPGNAGVPDRLIVMPCGRLYFVELKTDAGYATVLQKRQMDRLMRLGCDVKLVRGLDGVKDLLTRIATEQKEGDAV